MQLVMFYGGVGTPTAQHPKPLRQRDNVGVSTPSSYIFCVNTGCLITLHSSLTDYKVLKVTRSAKHWPWCYSFCGILIFYRSVYKEE